MSYEIFNEDCLEGMKRIPDNSIDMVCTDLPYNLTACKWDLTPIDLPAMWEQFKRILKPQCSAVMFASGKFTFKLVASNFEQFKYKWVWVKNVPTMFVQAKNAPMRKYEEICVFSDGVITHPTVTKRRMKYNPQGLIPCEVFKNNDGKDRPSQLRAGGRGERWTKTGENATKSQIHNPHPENVYVQEYTGYPSDVIESYNWRKGYNWERRGRLKAFGGTYGKRKCHIDCFTQEYTNYPADVLKFNALANGGRLHPTQKPVDLLEYLIRTYSNEGETVLDATMGSGSTGVAAINTGRNFIGFELEQKFFDIARKRIDDAIAAKAQSLF